MSTKEVDNRPYVIEQVVDGVITGRRFSASLGRFVSPKRGNRFRIEPEALAVTKEFGLRAQQFRIATITRGQRR